MRHARISPIAANKALVVAHMARPKNTPKDNSQRTPSRLDQCSHKTTPHLTTQAFNPGAAVLGPLEEEVYAHGGPEAVELLAQAVNHESTFFLRALQEKMGSLSGVTPKEVCQELFNASSDAFKRFAHTRGRLGDAAGNPAVEVLD